MGMFTRAGGALIGGFLTGGPIGAVLGYAMVAADEDEKKAAQYRDGKEAGYKNGEMKAKTELNKQKINNN